MVPQLHAASPPALAPLRPEPRTAPAARARRRAADERARARALFERLDAQLASELERTAELRARFEALRGTARRLREKSERVQRELAAVRAGLERRARG